MSSKGGVFKESLPQSGDRSTWPTILLIDPFSWITLWINARLRENRKEERRLGSMLFPAFKLQKTLRAKVLGPWFWRKATKRRRKARLIGADLCREYTKLKNEHLKASEGAGNRRGSAGAGGGDAARRAVLETEGGADRLSPAPEKLGTDDEGYRAEGERGVGGTEEEYGGSSSSSGSGSGSGSEPDQQTTQQQPDGRRVSIAKGDPGARRVSYASSLEPRGSVSLSTAEGRKGSVGVPGRRRSTKVALTGRSDSNIGRRRSSVALAAVSDQGAPGKRGSIFEGMQVYAPPAEAPAAEDDAGPSHRRRSSRKPSVSSRVTPGDVPPTEHADGG